MTAQPEKSLSKLKKITTSKRLKNRIFSRIRRVSSRFSGWTEGFWGASLKNCCESGKDFAYRFESGHAFRLVAALGCPDEMLLLRLRCAIASQEN